MGGSGTRVLVSGQKAQKDGGREKAVYKAKNELQRQDVARKRKRAMGRQCLSRGKGIAGDESNRSKKRGPWVNRLGFNRAPLQSKEKTTAVANCLWSA